MRVVQCFRAPIGGLFRHVADLALGLARRGVAVGLICDDTDRGELEARRLSELAEACALGLSRIPMARLASAGDVAAVRQVRRLVREQRIDVVHGHGAKGGAYARIAARLAGRPSLYTPHGGSLHYAAASASGFAYLALERALRRLGAPVLFESAFAEAVYRDKVGAPPALSRVVHNGLRPDEFEPLATRVDAADLLFIGELRALKGPFVLIEALARLAGDGPCPSLLVVGAGPDSAALAAAVPDNLRRHVTFAPPMPAREAFARGRLVVMPSLAESLPYIVLEAAAAARPMIATRAGGIPEIFGPQADRLVAPGDAAALAAAIAGALREPAAGERNAALLREEVARRFSIDRMVDAILATYHEVRAEAPPLPRPPGRRPR